MIFILGERPGPNTDPSRPLFPHTKTGAAARLANLLGFDTGEYLAKTTRYNACDSDAQSTSNVHIRALVEKRLLAAEQQPFIVLGKSALKSMPPHYRGMQFGEIKDNVLLLPHTSGVNRVWNDPDFKARMQAIVREFIHETARNSKDEDSSNG